MGITINNEELATNLLTLAIMCAGMGSDNCDITLTTNRGNIKCHIEFSDYREDEE